jgi:Family of unknown function (DUF6065)
MSIEFVVYQKSAVVPSRPDARLIFSRFSEGRRCPPFASTVSAGLWLYPPFDATVRVDAKGGFEVIVEEALEALSWTHRMHDLVSWASTWWCSKIPGVLQVDPGLIISTPPGQQLLVTQPMNCFESGYFVQSGLIDSDFFQAPFTVNLVPAPGQSSFLLRRHWPIAQLLNPNDALASISFEVSTIEARPKALAFWRSYIEAVFGSEPTTTDPSQTLRQRSVYRDWLACARRGGLESPGGEVP